MPKKSTYELASRPDKLYWSSVDCILMKAGGILAHSRIGSFIVDTQDPQLNRPNSEQNAQKLVKKYCIDMKCPLFEGCIHKAAAITLKTDRDFTFPAVKVF